MAPHGTVLLGARRLAVLRRHAAAVAAAARPPGMQTAAAARPPGMQQLRAAAAHGGAAAAQDELRDLEYRGDTRLALAAPPVVYHPLYSAPRLAAGHRFPMQVFAQIHRLLLADGVVDPRQVHEPAALPSRDLLHLVHTAEFVDAFCSGTLDDQRVRRIGFGEAVRSPLLVERTLSEVAGTILTAELALEHGLACNTAGGTHHAFPSHGSGFCILNDLAVAAELLLRQGRVARVLIADLDVHQGDGTAAIFGGRRDVFTLSVHAASNFPARKQASHLDVALPDGTGDGEYLRVAAEALNGALQGFRPDLVLYDAGVDTHADDALGRLALTDDGLRRRELLVGWRRGRALCAPSAPHSRARRRPQVLDACLAAGVPVAGFVGGGYHADLDVLARRHCALHRAAAQLWADHRL